MDLYQELANQKFDQGFHKLKFKTKEFGDMGNELHNSQSILTKRSEQCLYNLSICIEIVGKHIFLTNELKTQHTSTYELPEVENKLEKKNLKVQIVTNIKHRAKLRCPFIL